MPEVYRLDQQHAVQPESLTGLPHETAESPTSPSDVWAPNHRSGGRQEQQVRRDAEVAAGRGAEAEAAADAMILSVIRDPNCDDIQDHPFSRTRMQISGTEISLVM